MSKYFIHVYRAPKNEHGYIIPESIGCVELISWEIFPTYLKCKTVHKVGEHYQTIMEGFDPGNRFYIVENHGQCMEPNGDIIWSWADGFGDYKVAA